MKKKKTTNSNWEFVVVKYFFILIFAALILHFANFLENESADFINNDFNSREELFAERVTRGKIQSADGMLLATTVTNDDGEEERYYPYDNLFSHIVGYSVNGKYGVEKLANFELLKSHVSIDEKVENELGEVKQPGDTIVTTLNYELQQTVYDALSFYEGAIVVLEPKTGKILAMVSKPDFDPNEIDANWEDLISEDNTSTVLLNRAMQGLYPPGSTFKIVTTLAYLRENSNADAYSYSCNGKYETNDAVIHCYNNIRHGSVNLKDSFAESCNSSFANIGYSLSNSTFRKTCESVLFNKELPTKLLYSKSKFSLPDDAKDSDILQCAIGQGTTLVTPFHMALIVSAIANDGILMNPYVIDHIESTNGDLVKQYQPSSAERLMTQDEAKTLQTFMRAVVESGTGTKLKSKNYEAYGKTGSAEFSSLAENCHSWFVGYAKKDGLNDIAVAVLVEEAGSGSSVAVPIAKKIFDFYFSE